MSTPGGGGDRGGRWALLLLVVAPLLLHIDHLGAGRIPYLRDLSRTHLPGKLAAVTQMREGHLPLWNPAHGGGSPLLANANFFHLHPITLLFLALPYPTAFSLGLAALSVLGAAGTFLWLRQLGLSREAAATGGLAFALGGLGVSVANLYNLAASYHAVPWALWASGRLGAGRGRGNVALLAIALAACAAGGEPTAWAWSVMIALLLELEAGRRPRQGHLAAAALSLGLVALQVLPLAEATRTSLRGQGMTLAESTRYSLAPGRLVETVWPQAARDPTLPDPTSASPFAHLATPLLYSIYIGLTVTLLAVLGLRHHHWLATGTAAVSLLLALGAHTPLYPALFRLLPPLHYFRYPEKLLLPFFLAVALGAARGVPVLRALLPRMPALAPPFLVALDLLLAHHHLVPGAPAAAFLSPPPIASYLASHRTYFWIEPGPRVPPGDSLAAFHQEYVRQAVPPSGSPFGVSYVFDVDPDGLDPLRTLGLARAVHRAAARARLLPIAGIERVVSPLPLHEDGLEELATVDQVHVYAVRDPVPFARLLGWSDVRRCESAEEALTAIATPGFAPRREATWEGVHEPSAGGGGAARFRRPGPGTIEVELDGEGLLVVNESFDAGWQARLDGQPAGLGPANVAFLGLPVSGAGAHTARLEYRPRSVRLGLAISLGSLAVAALLLARSLRAS